MFYSTKGLVVGPEECVGVRHFKATSSHPPLRIFYPAKSSSSRRNRIGWFHENGLAFFLSGYAHTAGFHQSTFWFRWCILPLIHMVSFVLPMGWIKLPGVFLGAPFSGEDDNNKNKKRPVILFSHGLTGTGEENALLHASWAKRGFVVVSIHHSDGSSCRVLTKDGSSRYFDHGGSVSRRPVKQYDVNFRPKQIEQRVKESMEAYQFLKNKNDDCPLEIRQGVDMDRVIASGFSYGGATAALTVLRNPKLFCGLICLDGWFYIDVSQSAGIEFEFPKEIFDNQKALEPIPRLFVNSEQFRNLPKLWKTTFKLIQGEGAKQHLLKDTGHQNFADAIFWFPKFVLRRLAPDIGPMDPVVAYHDILKVTGDFLERVCSD